MESDVVHNFRNHVFYHGTSLEAAESIAQQGFQVWFEDAEIGRYTSGGNLGTGLYITCNWRMALWFGPTLLRVEIQPGTRLLNAALPPDGKTLAYLQHEFGHEILKKSPWKVLPKNKRLKHSESICLFLYHYHQTWEKDYRRDKDGAPRWPKRRTLHARRLDDFRKVLIRYGFHGYGNPADDNGLVVFSGDRLVLKEVVVQIPAAQYTILDDADFRRFQNLNDLRDAFQRNGSRRAKKLARQVAATDTDKSLR